ncbi:MAG: D-alanyl-D-alanine carboxypeptidase/D-alanyl-D-alanine-endopeptidase, partial [Prolixibacteraceae bacterium]|nr:D-alanyl-D-alanine carboxypeptidase/D-alanyl-D-alanine-endopeptidase [Prolixibacteraceae bacterium]
YIGKPGENNVLNGDLVVIGGGDPTLGSEHFSYLKGNDRFLEQWAGKIRAAGIRQVEGDLILDGSIYDSEKIPPTWIWEDMGNYYGAGASAFTIFDNLFRITFRSPRQAAKPTQILSINPPMPKLNFVNEVVSSNDNRDLAFVFGSPFDRTRVIRGTIPKNRSAFTIKVAMPHPEEVLAKELINQLAKKGVFLTGKIKYQKTDKSKVQVIYIHESPEMAEIVKVLNYESINLFAEHLLKQIAVEKAGAGSRGKGIEIINKYWASKDADTKSLIMEDGSGLSHFDAVSPAFFTQVLTYMYTKSANRNVFFQSLPPAGKGTLYLFDSQNFPAESLHAKSGSMTRVHCYAGYLTQKSGKMVAFSIMVNHFSGTHSKLAKAVETLLISLRDL